MRKKQLLMGADKWRAATLLCILHWVDRGTVGEEGRSPDWRTQHQQVS